MTATGGIPAGGSGVGDIRTAQAALRVGAAAVEAASVRPAFARFERAVSAFKAAQRPAAGGEDKPRPAVAEAPSAGHDASGGSAFTAFLAQSMAQQDDGAGFDDGPSRSLQQAGAAAYRRSLGADAHAAPAIDVMLPPLASGRALDLTV